MLMVFCDEAGTAKRATVRSERRAESWSCIVLRGARLLFVVELAAVEKWGGSLGYATKRRTVFLSCSGPGRFIDPGMYVARKILTKVLTAGLSRLWLRDVDVQTVLGEKFTFLVDPCVHITPQGDFLCVLQFPDIFRTTCFHMVFQDV